MLKRIVFLMIVLCFGIGVVIAEVHKEKKKVNSEA